MSLLRLPVLLSGLVLLLTCFPCEAQPVNPPGNTDDFKRGDANGDGCVDSLDSAFILNWLFMSGAPPECMDAADANDDGQVSQADFVHIENALLPGGPLLPAPGPDTCGPDPSSDTLDCQVYATASCDPGINCGVPTECQLVDNGTGTVDLPPAGCPYVGPSLLHMIVEDAGNNLPPGTQINIAIEHGSFSGVVITPALGPMGGEIENFNSVLHMEITGTGALASFSRTIDLAAPCEVLTGPRVAGDPVQTFTNEMRALEGMLTGDPDFALLHIKAGSDFGLPSPGQTTLTMGTGGDFNVDSFFDITYEIDFQGAPGGALAGLSGSATGSLLMGTPGINDSEFRRGDCNTDGGTDIADAVKVLNHLFPPSGTVNLVLCHDACDANDDGALNVADAVRILNALFGTVTVPLPAPYPGCGADPTADELLCATYNPPCP
ncbi:MAG: dockerin type I repeat-containing protein [Planctomycetota bacterium]